MVTALIAKFSQQTMHAMDHVVAVAMLQHPAMRQETWLKLVNFQLFTSRCHVGVPYILLRLLSLCCYVINAIYVTHKYQ